MKRPRRRTIGRSSSRTIGGLADAGVAGEQDELGDAGGGDAIERLVHGGGLGVAAVEALGDAELVGDVALAERERGDRAALGPLVEAALEIVAEAGGALVAVVGELGEEAVDEVDERAGQRGAELVEGARLAGDVGVGPADGVGRPRTGGGRRAADRG